MDLNESDDLGAYCRAVEDYLCRKSGGHRIRIAGPAFDLVCGWAARGVPLKITQRGIDRYCERYYAKGPQRRPVRVEFCEADVLDVFDEWRRAVGLGSVGSGGAGGSGSQAADSAEGSGRRHGSLPAHLDRAIARLTTLRGGEHRPLDAVLDAIVRELDTARAAAKGLRGEARAAFIERLRALDGTLMAAAREQCDENALRQLASEADAELAPFRDRMPREAFEQSHRACIDRLIRERGRLPVLTYDA